MNIMRRTPGSVLWLLEPSHKLKSSGIVENIRCVLAKRASGWVSGGRPGEVMGLGTTQRDAPHFSVARADAPPTSLSLRDAEGQERTAPVISFAALALLGGWEPRFGPSPLLPQKTSTSGQLPQRVSFLRSPPPPHPHPHPHPSLFARAGGRRSSGASPGPGSCSRSG
jgi:hypothetical protein